MAEEPVTAIPEELVVNISEMDFDDFLVLLDVSDPETAKTMGPQQIKVLVQVLNRAVVGGIGKRKVSQMAEIAKAVVMAIGQANNPN